MTIKELTSIKINTPDVQAAEAARSRWDAIAKPIDGLGDFEDLVCKIAAAKADMCPDLSKKALVIMCADNGVVLEGVSQTDQSVTRDVAALMGRKESSVGMMAKHYPLEIFTVDVGINCEGTPKGVIDKKVRKGTGDILKGPAMSVEECLKAIEAGIEMVKLCRDKKFEIIATGEMGIGNTTTATALLCALTGLEPAAVTGRGAGLTDEGLEHKIEVIEETLKFHLDDKDKKGIRGAANVFEALRKFGGLDIAGLVGVYIGGAMLGIPIVIDGFISAVAAFTAEGIVKGCKDFMIASHKGREKGAEEIMNRLGLKPVIDADLALGEGTGAIMLFPLLDMVMSLFSGGVAFNETTIKQYERFRK